MARHRATEFEILEALGGLRLDAAMAELGAAGSRSQAARLIDRGAVLLNGRPGRKSDRVAAGDRVEVADSTPAMGGGQDPTVPFTVVFEDDDIIVVDKPAGLVVHPAPGNRSGTLSQALAGRAGGGAAERTGIVHRLDKDTSGLLVVSRNDKALRALQSAIQRREVRRRYTALVAGKPDSESGTIDAPLGRARKHPEQVAVRRDGGRDSITHFEVIERLGPRTLLGVALESGRTHQIRVHLAAIGLPVCGDETYGRAADLGLKRQFLHASGLAFAHPVDGRAMEFSSELPPDLAAALERARADR